MGAETYLEPTRTFPMEFFCENSKRLKTVNYFRKKAPSQMFDWAPNTTMGESLKK